MSSKTTTIGAIAAARSRRVCAGACLLAFAALRLLAQPGDTVAEARQAILAPSDDARIMMRWWWFGPAVVNGELDREMRQMKAGGIGGFEIQPVYAQALDDPTTGFKNLPYLSAPFLDAVRFANERAHDLGLRADVTLASGWPYGGPHTPITQAAGRLRLVRALIPANSTSVALPFVGAGEALVAGLLFNGAEERADTSAAVELPLPPSTGLRIALPGPTSAPRQVWFFVSSRTGQMVKRAAVAADGFVLDHFDKAAINAHLHDVGEPLLAAFGDMPPYAVFSDSLEVYESDWTPNFADEFKRRRGYDIVPYLPLLFAGNSDEARSVRHDWGETLTELVNENYLGPIAAWAHEHHTRFRSQTYGEPAVDLSSNALVDLPEGEGPQWRTFSYTRWAASASHLYGRNVTSAEAWTWLHSPAFRATPLDMKAEADLFFLQGVNQIVGHGWPYTPPGVAEPGWAFYAAAVFNDHNPWWIVMPDVASYLQRASALLRQGRPANDVAVYVPTDDAWADFKPGHVAVTDNARTYITPELTTAILDAGYNLDYIDAAAIDAGKLRPLNSLDYPVLILPHVDRISPSTYRKIADYAAHGGKVVAVGRLPEHGTGLQGWQQDSSEVAAISHGLLTAPGFAVAVKDDSALGDVLGTVLHRALVPDVGFTPFAAELGVVHRKLADGDVYFIANTSNRRIAATAHFRRQPTSAEVWDLVHDTMRSSPSGAVELDLQPYESAAVLLHDRRAGPAQSPEQWDVSTDLNMDRNADRTTDVSTGWTATFQSTGDAKPVSLPYLWNRDVATEYYSGVVSFSRDIELPAVKKSSTWWIDFGNGTQVDPLPAKQLGTRALLDGPVRDAAVVYVNGKRAGSAWCPPYKVDVTGLLHAGSNRLEIRVANTAINTLAGRSLPDYRLLNQLYGTRFQPQDMDHLTPLPSGIAGTVKLIEESGGRHP